MLRSFARRIDVFDSAFREGHEVRGVGAHAPASDPDAVTPEQQAEIDEIVKDAGEIGLKSVSIATDDAAPPIKVHLGDDTKEALAGATRLGKIIAVVIGAAVIVWAGVTLAK